MTLTYEFNKDYLIKLRTSKNLTQEQLAKKVGVSKEHINRWENGKSIPTLNHLLRLGKALKVKFYNFVIC